MKRLSTHLGRLLIFLSCTFSFTTLRAQHCGTTLETTESLNPAGLRDFIRINQHQRTTEKTLVGITVHIVEQVAGAANISLDQLYRELDAVNQIYTSSGLEFFYCGSPRTIGGGRSIYTYQEAADQLNRVYHIPNTINIFYLDEIGDQQLSSFACGISTFPFNSTPESRFIIMQKDCSTNGSTLAHEIGHFFGLLHTHETALGVELVNRSNCESAGDLLCDTPADPNLAFTGLSGCNYTAPFTDLNGDLYRPDPGNIMSYAPASCRRKFSDEQILTMQFWYESELSYLVSECQDFPDYTVNGLDEKITISSGQWINLNLGFGELGNNPSRKVAIEILLQSESEVIPFTIFRDSIVFSGQTADFLENLEIPVPLSASSGEYELTIILDPDGEILERDKRNNILKINLLVDNSSYADITLFPNPAADLIKIFYRDKGVSGKTTITVTDLLGRSRIVRELFKNKEELFAELDLSKLQTGAYFVTLAFDKSERRESYLFFKN